MKIALVIYGNLDILSGGYLYDRKLVEYLRSQGDTVEVVSLPWRNYAAHLSDNLTFRLPRDFDLVIQDELNHPSLIAANRRPRAYPVISLVHHLRSSEQRPGWQNAFYRWLETRYLRSVDGFIFNSETTAGVVHNLIGSTKPYVIALPPTDRFGRGLSDEEVSQRAARTPFRIAFVGNVIPRKGLSTLLEAVDKLNREAAKTGKESVDLRIDIVGSLETDRAYAQSLQEFARANRQSSIVKFHGSLAETPLSMILREGHLLVVPSSYEGYGIAYVEGMGFGLPAIGTTSGAAGEIIVDADTGYLIAPGDAKTLAARIRSLAQDRLLLARLSLRALQRYRSQPGWEQTAGTIRGFLQMILTMGTRPEAKHNGR